jgi:hypothetical protein
MSRSLSYTVHLRPSDQDMRCTESSRKLTGRALGRTAWLVQVQLERGGLWVLAQTRPRVTP